MDSTEPLADRLIRLESVMMHLAHEVEQMHQVILAQQRDLDDVRSAVSRIDAQIEGAAVPEVRDPVAEKPPHY